MATHQEPLNGGLVTNRDPGLLNPGELAAIQNAHYVPGKQSLVRSKGRAVFGPTGVTANVVGLRDVKFDNGDHYLIAHASNNYFSAPVGTTGTFSALFTGASGSSLEIAHWSNRFFLFNGQGPNQIVYLSATAASVTPSMRRHGLQPVESTPEVTTASGTFSQTDVTGYFEYWTTEVLKLTADGAPFELESTFVGNPKTVFVATTATVPTININEFRNASANYWRVYRSPSKAKESDKRFPIGFLVGEMATSTTAMADTLTTTSTSLVLPASANTSAERYGQFTSATGATTDDAGATNATVLAAFGVQQSQGYYAFNLGGFAGNVRGVEVQVRAKSSVANKTGSITLGPGRSNSTGGFTTLATATPVSFFNQEGQVRLFRTATKSFLVTSTSYATYTLGGSADNWGAKQAWSDGEFGAAFMAIINWANAATLDVDFIKLRVYYSAAFDSVTAFPAVVIESSELTASVGRDGEPPAATTGDVFEGSLVTNNVAVPGRIHWSSPLLPESFPSVYFDDIETKENDRVTCIKTLNNRLIVGLTTSLWRVNYLPNEADANFSRGRAKELISSQFGIYNEMSACLYTMEGGRQELAFASDKGVFTTDGFEINCLTNDLDWRTTVLATSNSSLICLINDPENWSLWLFYRQDALGTDSYRKIQFCYHPDHMKAGRPKIGGPVFVRNVSGANTAEPYSAWAVRRSNSDTSIYTGYGGATAASGGQVTLDTGTTIPSSDQAFGFTTRRMFLAGYGDEWEMGNVVGYVSSQAGTQTISYTPLTVKTNDTTGVVTRTAKTLSLAGQVLHRVPFQIGGEGIALQMAITSGHNTLGMEFLNIEGQEFGEADSGIG